MRRFFAKLRALLRGEFEPPTGSSMFSPELEPRWSSLTRNKLQVRNVAGEVSLDGPEAEAVILGVMGKFREEAKLAIADAGEERARADRWLSGPAWLERDRLWCQVLVDSLDVEQIQRVTARFNAVRPDVCRCPDYEVGVACRKGDAPRCCRCHGVIQ